MQAKNQKNTTSMGSFDDAFITETEYHQRVLMLNQIEGLLLFVDEIKFDGMELLEQEEDELGSIDFEDDDCFTVDSLELNIKRIAPSKYRARNKKITRRCTTGNYQNGAAVLDLKKNDQTKSNDGTAKLSGGSLHGKVKQRRFSTCAA
jgi:hypothetical protein